MTFTKTTTRALAASIAIVFAGATLAGAAVFHVPVLGFRAAAAAGESPAHHELRMSRHAVRPRAVVRVRYVDDIVHRPAPATTYSNARAVAPTPPARAMPVAFASSAPPSRAFVAPQLTSPATSHFVEGDHEPIEHDSHDHAPSSGQRLQTTGGGDQ